MLNSVATHSRLRSGTCIWSLSMKSCRVVSAFEPMIVWGIVVSLSLVGLRSVGTLISRHVQPLASVGLASEEPTPVALANDESRTNR